MPKLKVRKSISKRFRITRTGKIIRRKAGKSHLLTKKSSRHKQDIKHYGITADADKNKIKRLLPYG